MPIRTNFDRSRRTPAEESLYLALGDAAAHLEAATALLSASAEHSAPLPPEAAPRGLADLARWTERILLMVQAERSRVRGGGF